MFCVWILTVCTLYICSKAPNFTTITILFYLFFPVQSRHHSQTYNRICVRTANAFYMWTMMTTSSLNRIFNLLVFRWMSWFKWKVLIQFQISTDSLHIFWNDAIFFLIFNKLAQIDRNLLGQSIWHCYTAIRSDKLRLVNKAPNIFQ